GRMEDAKRFGREAIALADDPAFDSFVWAFADLAMVASIEGDGEEAVRLMRAGAAHPADRGDRFCLAFLLCYTAAAGYLEDAMQMAEHVTVAVETAGVPSSIAVAYWAKGQAFEATEPVVALKAYEHGLQVAS